jgi:hypothetical protein
MPEPASTPKIYFQVTIVFTDGQKIGRAGSASVNYINHKGGLEKYLADKYSADSSHPIKEVRVLSQSSDFIDPATAISPDILDEEDDAESSGPPFFAELICRILVKKSHRDAIIGDLAADHNRNTKARGKKRADLIYWSEVVRSLLPMMSRIMSRIAWASVGSAIGRWFHN